MEYIQCTGTQQGVYEATREINGQYYDSRHTHFLPLDINNWIDQQIKLGYEVGIFDIVKRQCIYKSEGCKGYPSYERS